MTIKKVRNEKSIFGNRINFSMKNDFLVVVYLSMCDEDDSPIEVETSDVAKVKVFVEETEKDIQLPKTRDFVIRLKQLTLSEIQKHTEKPNVVLHNTVDDNENKRHNQKRKYVAKSQYLTRSKRRKLDETISTHIETQNNGSEKSSVALSSSNLLVAPIANMEPSADSQNVERAASEETGTSNASTINGSNHAMAICTQPPKVGEVIWGKIRGWPHWPGKIVHIFPRQFEVIWYNDFRVTKLYRSQIFKFVANFQIFAEKFDTTIGLREAAEQAMHDLMKRRE